MEYIFAILKIKEFFIIVKERNKKLSVRSKEIMYIALV